MIQGRCCLPAPEERREATERLWTLTRLAIREKRDMPRRRGLGENLGPARDCFRSSSCLMCYYFTIMFCEERQVIKVNVITVTVNSTLDGWRQPPNSIPSSSTQCSTKRMLSFQMTSSAPFGLHSGYKNATLRLWQSCGTEVAPHNLMLPLFITDESPDAK